MWVCGYTLGFAFPFVAEERTREEPTDNQRGILLRGQECLVSCVARSRKKRNLAKAHTIEAMDVP